MRRIPMLAALVAALVATPVFGQNSQSSPTAQLRPVDRQTLAGTVTAANTCAASGFAAGTSCVMQYSSGMGSALVTLAGAFTATLTFQVLGPDGVWVTVAGTPFGGGAAVLSVTAAGSWIVNIVGFQAIRVQCTAFTSSPAISLETVPAAPLVFASAAMLGSFRADPSQVVTPPGQWGIQQQPVAATQATISRSAGAGTIRHVATGFIVCISAVAAQPDIIFNLRDGATGAGTIIWSVRLANPTAGSSTCVPSGPLNIVGTAATAMTLESATAPAATNFATVSLAGYDVL